VPDDHEDDRGFGFEPPAGSMVILFGTLIEAALGAFAWAIGRAIDLDAANVEDWRWADFGIGTLATIPMLVLFFVCVKSRWQPFAAIRRVFNDLLVPLFQGAHWSELAALSLAAGLGEELLFRGLLQSGLGRVLNPWIAVVIVSLVFGLAHAITPTYVVVATFLGLYLGALHLLLGSLLVVIVAHALYDFIALSWLLRRQAEPAAQGVPPGP
jgi:membrane protease YdiL (CAAX protease family)